MVISVARLKVACANCEEVSAAMKRGGHNYRHGAKSRAPRRFKPYRSKGGKRGKGGDYIYGGVVGKLTRQRYWKKRAVAKATAGHRGG
jgi:hypothetical protein